MRVTFVISSLAAGGAERVLATMANYWASQGWAVTILTYDDGAQPPFYPLAATITHHGLGLVGESTTPLAGLGQNLRRLWVLRRAIQRSRPAVVISFTDLTNIRVLLALRFSGLPVLVSERVDPRRHRIGKVWRQLRRLTYPMAQQVIVQSQTVRDYFLRQSIRKVTVIPNPVLPPPTITEPVGRNFQPYLISIGRLDPQKGFDLLLQAFQQIYTRYPAWRLLIVGDGDQREPLTTLAYTLGLATQVVFVGRTKQVYDYLHGAELFVLASRYEGFPNVLGEAMACGLPVISFDCPSGPRELIRDGVDGVLVPPEDVPALAAALDRLLSDSAYRQQLAARAPEIIERFGIDQVMGLWEVAIKAAIGEKE
ncbi:MAG: glycosyltransferase family 4 protein [Caldilineaceae bacterium]